MVGSAYWMAPEMIARKAHGCKADIFSLGMVIYELMAGEPLTTLFKPLQVRST
jgi:p21-activated kinase 1